MSSNLIKCMHKMFKFKVNFFNVKLRLKYPETIMRFIYKLNYLLL